jgi:hypothetical protein
MFVYQRVIFKSKPTPTKVDFGAARYPSDVLEWKKAFKKAFGSIRKSETKNILEWK